MRLMGREFVGASAAWAGKELAMARFLVRGSGDIGSAIALRLRSRGHAVILHDVPRPAHARRGMSFTDALFDGTCTLEGTFAKRAHGADSLGKMLACGGALPVSDAPFDEVLPEVLPDVIVDARVHKHGTPEALLGLAPVSIGLGPGFVAGVNADLVIETAWGEALGQVIRDEEARGPIQASRAPSTATAGIPARNHPRRRAGRRRNQGGRGGSGATRPAPSASRSVRSESPPASSRRLPAASRASPDCPGSPRWAGVPVRRRPGNAAAFLPSRTSTCFQMCLRRQQQHGVTTLPNRQT